MKLSTLILSKSAKNKDKKEYFPLNFVREFLVRKKAIFMKIRLDFKRGNSHAFSLIPYLNEITFALLQLIA